MNFFGKCDDCGDVTCVNGHAFSFRGDAAITGGTPNFFHARAFSQFPHQCVFASSATQHENLHALFLVHSPSNDRRPSRTCQLVRVMTSLRLSESGAAQLIQREPEPSRVYHLPMPS